MLRAAAIGTMTIPLNGGDLIATTRASTLVDCKTLATMHTALLAATSGTAAYADGAMVTTVRLGTAGPYLVHETLSQLLFTTIAAMRAMAYLPTSNITYSDPSTFFLSRNFVAICDAAEAAVVATGAGVGVSVVNTFYTSPVVIFVAVYIALSLLGCVVVFAMSRHALDFRIVPLERMSKLPNSVLQRLESAAASSVAAAERAVEYAENAGGDEDSQEDEEAIDWRSVNLTHTSKDMQKGTSERPRERLIFSCMLMAPLLLSSVVFVLLVNAIWTGTVAADISALALTGSTLTQVAVRQTVYYGIQGSTLSDADGSDTLAAAVRARTKATARVNDMFFSTTAESDVTGTLEAIHFGDLCAPGVLPLSAFESARCPNLAGRVCHSGLHAALGYILRSAEAVLKARSRLTFSRPPTPSQIAALRGVLDQQWVSDMRVISINEAAPAFAIDAGVRAAHVQAAVTSAESTGNALASVVIVGAIVYQVRAAKSCYLSHYVACVCSCVSARPRCVLIRVWASLSGWFWQVPCLCIIAVKCVLLSMSVGDVSRVIGGT